MTPIMDCAFKFLLRDCSYSARVNISLLLRILQNDALSSWYMQVVLVSGIMCAAYIQKVICSFRYIYCRSCMQMEWVEVFFPLLYRSFKKISFCPNSKKKNSVAFQCRKKWFILTIFSSPWYHKESSHLNVRRISPLLEMCARYHLAWWLYKMIMVVEFFNSDKWEQASTH